VKPSSLAGLIALLLLGALVGYFLSDPDEHRTARLTRRFDEASAPGAHIADAVRASPDFKSITFGGCGHLDASPDSGPKGSLIFSPVIGAFARYTSFDEFLKDNPTLLSRHEECRTLSVLYETIFPYRGQIDLVVDGRGLVLKKAPPVFFF
jgi:hypothetical protein